MSALPTRKRYRSGVMTKTETIEAMYECQAILFAYAQLLVGMKIGSIIISDGMVTLYLEH